MTSMVPGQAQVDAVGIRRDWKARVGYQNNVGVAQGRQRARQLRMLNSSGSHRACSSVVACVCRKASTSARVWYDGTVSQAVQHNAAVALANKTAS